MQYNIECRDVLDWAATYDGPKFHALLCDPPYHLTNRVVDWNGFSDPHQGGRGKPVLKRETGGFMGKKWDGGDISFRPETWAALAEHLLPGAFVMAFAGARTYHRIAVAIEDAGLIMHPSIFGWAYGSGFPKATRIDTQIDSRGGQNIGWFGAFLREYRKGCGMSQRELCELGGWYDKVNHGGAVTNWELGYNLPTAKQFNKLVEILDLPVETLDEAEREVVGKSDNKIHLANLGSAGYNDEWDITLPATDLAAQWQGHRYGLQALKPALEPILVFQKPWEGKRLDCIVETGAGSLNVDGGRIASDRKDTRHGGGAWSEHIQQIDPDAKGYELPQGRWPANFALCHSPECKRDGVRRVKPAGGDIAANSKGAGARNNMVYGQDNKPRGEWKAYKDADGTETVANWVCVESCPVRRLGEQSGESVSSGGTGGSSNHFKLTNGSRAVSANVGGVGDKGTAARFFLNADWSHEVAEQLAQADPVRYQAKAARKERDAGLDKLEELDTISYSGYKVRVCNVCDNRSNWDGKWPNCEHNDWRWDTLEDTGKAHGGRLRNPHPTVKPIALTQWLATLLLPPDAYAPRRILIPFGGSASEGIGAMLAGWEHITLVEMSDEYCNIARARLAWWTEQAHGQMWPEVKEILKRI